ncbi:hypothetical protein SAMN02745824_3329 [Parasphingorhabdus marina DSM 22363]|uniref:Capsule polysaccharide biosynthesis protein n=1 Tax=Parasphingorhabdus marina DSM 22363 TaxID=1123272 RepID=A0A1N6HKK8_9SPHN|nr:hypothetical protein [Parasphingorhabdus marina]SIO20175.1 hypothetical protein SAMN02745824_3329 [Parasphingorhabdus marina DSM 22363]
MAQARMQVMFYLPVVTPWWFSNIIVHLIRVMARVHDVHVLIPPLWRNTGLGEDQLPLIANLTHVNWIILDGPDHPALRSDASGEEDLITLVEKLNPDLTLCRSADIATPGRFPGTVRYIMEGGAPPAQTGANWVTLSPGLFDHGLMPELSTEDSDRLDQLAGPIWAQMHQQTALPSREEFLALAGLPTDRIIIGLPLEYENEENFFGQHHRYPDNAAMIRALASGLRDNSILAVTNHPLNELYGDNRALEAAIAGNPDRVVMIDGTEIAGQATLALSWHSDGMVVGNSKSWSACAAFGTPVLRMSDFATGDWLQAYDVFRDFAADIDQSVARRADAVQARRWFTFHLANNVFDPSDPALEAGEIVSRMKRPVDPFRWDQGLARYLSQPSEKAA